MSRKRRLASCKEEAVSASSAQGWVVESSVSSSQHAAQFPLGFLDGFRYPVAETSSSAIQRSSSVVKKEQEQEQEHEHEEKERPPFNLSTTKRARIKDEYLPNVPDYVKKDLDILFIGSNPGRMSSQKGQHFSHPSNHFYRTLHRSGLTPDQVAPENDYTMLTQRMPYFSLGLTNLAARPTRMAHELAREENVEGATILRNLLRRHRPRTGVFVGIGVARAFEQSMQVTKSTAIKCEKVAIREDSLATIQVPCDIPCVGDKDLGLGVGLLSIAVRHDPEVSRVKCEDSKELARLPFTLLFACPSTSGRVTSHQLPQKTECMRRVRLLTEHLTRSASSTPQSQAEYKTLTLRLV